MAQNPALFIRVAATIAELKANLAEGRSNIETTTAAMQKLATSFSGDRLIQAAHNVTAAVNEIGGASKLTEAEQARVNATLERALEKYRVLGKDAPAGMQQLADETRKVNTTQSQWLSTLTSVTAAIGIAFSVNAIVQFSKDLFASTGRLQDLSDATGVGTDALQRMRYVFVGFDVDMETAARAISAFSSRLAGGDPSATRAVEALGLNVQELIQLTPDEAFLRWADAASRIDNPMLKSANASDVLGQKLARLLVPALAGLRSAMEAVPQSALISPETIASADRFDDALKRVWITTKAFIAEGVTNGIIKLKEWADINSMMTAPQLGVAAAVKRTTDIVLEHNASVTTQITQADLMRNAVTKWRTEGMEPLNAAQKETIEIGDKLGKSQNDIVQVVGASSGAVHKYIQALKDQEAAETKAAAATERIRDAFDELRSSGDGWRGTLAGIEPVLVTSIKQYLDAGVSQSALALAYGLTATQIKAVASAMKDETDTLKVEQKTLVDTEKLWAEYNALKVQHGATALQAQLAQIEQWADAQALAARQAGITDKSYYDALAALSAEKAQSLMVDWTAIGSNSRSVLQETADKAAATYRFMLEHSSDFATETIEKFRQTAESAQLTADTWNASFTSALDVVEQKVTQTTAKVQQTALTWNQAMDLVRKGEGTLTGSVQNAVLDPKQKEEQRQRTARAYSEGRYYGPVKNGAPDYEAIGLREHGGPVTQGSPYIVGERGPELFVPDRTGTIVPSGGGGSHITIAAGAVQINYPLMNDPRARMEIAAMVGDALMVRLRQQGLRVPSGA